MQPARHMHIPPRLLIQWHITERCNLQCTHCYQTVPPPADPPLSQLLAVLEQIRDLITRLNHVSARPIPVHLTLTGGEPFLHPEFFNLLEQIASQPRTVRQIAILTNGSLLDRCAAARLALLKPAFVQISIEGAEATHDRIRGAGSFQRAVRGLRLLVDRRIPSYISFTAHRDNVADFPAVAALARSLRITRLWADRLIPLGQGAADSGRLLSPDDTRAFFETMKREKARHSLSRTEIVMHRALQFLIGGGKPYRCAAGRTLLTILPDGGLLPCRRLPLPAGNVFDTPLPDLYFSSPVLRALREQQDPPASCAKCFYSRLCHGGLRCLAHAVHGTPHAADPGCWLAPQFAHENNPALTSATCLPATSACLP